MSENVKFKCKIEKEVFNSPTFKVYGVSSNILEYPFLKYNKYGNISIFGDIPTLRIDSEYEVEGLEETNKNGIGYKVQNIKTDKPLTQEGVFTFLCEILTYNQASTLYEYYPDIIQRVKENRFDDVDLNKLKGIKEKTFEKIKGKIIENFCLIDIVSEFQGYISLNTVKKLFQKYTSVERIREELNRDAYKCLCGIGGVGFKSADRTLLKIEEISKKNLEEGKEPIMKLDEDLKTSVKRCVSYIIYVLKENENNGHTKGSLVEMRSQCFKDVPECADRFVEALSNENIYYNKETLEIALMSTYNTEKKIAEIILEDTDYNEEWNFDIEDYRKVEEGSELTDEQLSILPTLIKNKVSILNGAAGSGKSYSTQAVIKMLEKNKKRFLLLSPTGKAAKVLAEYTKRPTSTIHRGLGYFPPSQWQFNELNKLDVDVVIVDEFSMVDVWLFSRLIKAIDFEATRLLLIGDDSQLPSVGSGNLLKDFIDSRIIPTVTLSKIFRYSEGGLMTVATDARMSKPFLSGTKKKVPVSYGTGDYVFVEMNAQDISTSVIPLYRKLLNEGYTSSDIQFLTAKNKGECGVEDLNNQIQTVANENYGSDNKIKVGNITYYEDDLVLQRVNNYKAEIVEEVYENEFMLTENEAFVANGETGKIIKIENGFTIINFDGVFVRYNISDLQNVSLGYAMTIHKSQGSSIKIVVLCTPNTHSFMLSSNLIYVGLTRMREKLYHLGSSYTINQAVKKKENFARNTFMKDFLTKEIKSVDLGEE